MYYSTEFSEFLPRGRPAVSHKVVPAAAAPPSNLGGRVTSEKGLKEWHAQQALPQMSAHQGLFSSKIYQGTDFSEFLSLQEPRAAHHQQRSFYTTRHSGAPSTSSSSAVDAHSSSARHATGILAHEPQIGAKMGVRRVFFKSPLKSLKW